MYLEKFNLTGQHAVVTGGGRGIGLACAGGLLEAGAEVTILEIDEKLAEEGVRTLADRGYRIEAQICDVTDSNRVTQIADDMAAGRRPASILVNSAGIALAGVPAEDVTDERWLKVIDVNLNGTFYCCRAFGNQMLRAGGGSIVNLGSMSGYIVNRPQVHVHYNTSKAAVHQLTRTLAVEWATHNVRVNAVAPTYIKTPLNDLVKDDPEMLQRWIDGTPMARMGEDHEVASVVLFLASDAASLMTGSIVLADGGYTAW